MVQDICNGTSTSAWSTAVTFTTAAGPLPTLNPNFTVISMNPVTISFTANASGQDTVGWAFSNGADSRWRCSHANLWHERCSLRCGGRRQCMWHRSRYSILHGRLGRPQLDVPPPIPEPDSRSIHGGVHPLGCRRCILPDCHLDRRGC
jgi:hypothetical protein